MLPPYVFTCFQLCFVEEVGEGVEIIGEVGATTEEDIATDGVTGNFRDLKG